MRKKFFIFVITLIIVTTAAWLSMEGHGFDFDAYEQVRDGMTTSQIEVLLGTPSSIIKLQDGESIWKYSSQWKWCIGNVHFGRDNKVKGKEHDH